MQMGGRAPRGPQDAPAQRKPWGGGSRGSGLGPPISLSHPLAHPPSPRPPTSPRWWQTLSVGHRAGGDAAVTPSCPSNGNVANSAARKETPPKSTPRPSDARSRRIHHAGTAAVRGGVGGGPKLRARGGRGPRTDWGSIPSPRVPRVKLTPASSPKFNSMGCPRNLPDAQRSVLTNGALLSAGDPDPGVDSC